MVTTTLVIDNLSGEASLAFSKNGLLYFSSSGGTIDRLDSTQTSVITEVTASDGATGGAAFALDSNDNIYWHTNDIPNNAFNIYKKTSAGIISILGQTPGISFGMALDANGDIYAACYNGSILKITASSGNIATFLTAPSGVAPACIAFDSAGNLYYTDFNGPNIYKVTSGTTVSNVFITSNIHNQYGYSLAINNGNIYVTSATTSIIEVYDNSGTISSTITLPYIGRFLAFDSTGHLYCSTASPNNIYKITDSSFVAEPVLAAKYPSPSLTPPASAPPLAPASAGTTQSSSGSGTTQSSSSSSTVASSICFIANTPIVTDQGIIAIDKINPKVHTIRNNQIKLITKTVTDDKYLVCFEKDALGPNIPSKTTIMSKNHALLYKGKMVRAKDLINKNNSIYRVKYTGETLYNVLMETHEKILVNNLVCETLEPNCMIAELFTHLETLEPRQQESLIKAFNSKTKTLHNSSK
jgi:streptogramin lyase